MLEVSRTPIRQALKILEFEGLVNLFPRRGAYVPKLSQRDAKELYAMLGMMEGFACSQLVPLDQADLTLLEQIIIRAEKHIQNENLREVTRANLEFHETIVKMANNKRLFSMYMIVRKPTRIFQSIGLSSSDDWKTSLQDHKQILVAIREGQTLTASQLSLEHNIKSCNRVVSRFFKLSEDHLE